ncbi:ATP-binding protein [Anabaenopsis tanganyikae CS-531]|uniref:histidine kinase n=2 Tax=Anabaenopsis TaxID=110103 RepID=A0ABT6KEJ6_9CYAN|nr:MULTISPECIES: hybrid sensor histidine kinase/response regulator [Anabaenopsis]MDB9539675.1 ATP-binding protein [Anabaenopsis arnoldii]MDH6091980.1 ATP-binding protein [Anabaenopsis arnoldii]MDH6106263.1 ATP-binding protein [Anabaenopsis tanganyikae CS-531]
MKETLRILVVDDDEVDRMRVRQALTQAGVCMEMSEVSNGSDALAALRTTTYDCVFLDYCLPDQDVLVLIQRLRSLEITVPLVVFTTHTDEKIAMELMESGATDYLSKSRLCSETLAQVLRYAIRIHRAQMQAALANQRLRETNERLIRQNQEVEKQRQQIQLQNFKLLEASRLKSQFLATISHELRTPMNAILGFSQILLRPKFGKLTNQQTDMVERILNNGKNLLMLLNEVLDFSQLEVGQLELEPELFDLTKTINIVVAQMRSVAEAKKLSLGVDIDMKDSLVFNDSGRIRQILINLLSNAIKFTDSGAISLEVKELPNNQLAIAVRDTGIGIAPRDFQHIFEAFRQVDQSMTRKYPGTGLGLAIIDSLVQMMGGHISVESQLGVGSMFRIEVPRQLSLPSKIGTLPGLNLDGHDILCSVQNPNHCPPKSRKASMGFPHLKL